MSNNMDNILRELMDDDSASLVELRPCYEYTCEDCGKDSYQRITVRETRDGCFMIACAKFSCVHCGSSLKGIPWMPYLTD